MPTDKTRTRAIRQFIRIVLKGWCYKMPILWFVSHGKSAYISNPPSRISLRHDTKLRTVLHELIHYRDDQDNLALGPGVPKCGVMTLSAWNIEAKDEAITEELASQLEKEYEYLWNKLGL